MPVDLPQLGVLLGHRLLPRRAVVILEIGHDLLQVVHINGVLSELTLDLSERLIIQIFFELGIPWITKFVRIFYSHANIRIPFKILPMFKHFGRLVSIDVSP